MFLAYDRGPAQGDGDLPRKTGFSRLWEVFSRDYWKLMLSGLMALAAMIPFAGLMALSVGTHSLLLMLLAGVVGGAAEVPLLCGVADTVMRGLRDEPGFWWRSYRKALSRNWRASLLPGVVFGVVLSIQIFTLAHLRASGGGMGLLLCQLFGLLAVSALLLLTVSQLVLMEMPFGAIMKNSLLMAIRYLPRALAAAFAQLVYWLLIALFFPPTMTVLLLTSLWLPLLLGVWIIYPALDESFHIEDRLSRGSK